MLACLITVSTPTSKPDILLLHGDPLKLGALSNTLIFVGSKSLQSLPSNFCPYTNWFIVYYTASKCTYQRYSCNQIAYSWMHGPVYLNALLATYALRLHLRATLTTGVGHRLNVRRTIRASSTESSVRITTADRSGDIPLSLVPGRITVESVSIWRYHSSQEPHQPPRKCIHMSILKITKCSCMETLLNIGSCPLDM